MSKKKPGGKSKKRPSQRPSAPPIDLTPKSVPPSSVDETEEAAADSESPPSSEAGQKARSSVEPPPPPDTFAPTSTGEASVEGVAAVAAHGNAAKRAAADGAEISPPEATPAGISVDVIPERASARRLATEEEADRAFFEGAAAAEAKLHAEVHKQIAHEEVLRAPVRRITPEVVARRDKMKRIVTAVVAVAGVLSLGVFAKMAMGPKQHAFDESAVKAHAARQVEPVRPPVAGEVVAPPPRKVDAPPPPPSEAVDAEDEALLAAAVASVNAAPATSVAPPLAASSDAPPAASAAAAPSASAAASAAPPEPAAGATPDPDKAKPLTKKALQALETGKYAAAIEHATASIEADPTDANAYLYWGTALMETGKRADAKAVFAKCMSTAKRGPKHECASFAR